MGLDVFWENERGEIIERGPVWTSPWSYVESENDLEGTCCLQFIDEYGDTTFNQLQVPILIRELESLIPKSKDAESRKLLESLIDFIRKAEDQIHTYIKFYGD